MAFDICVIGGGAAGMAAAITAARLGASVAVAEGNSRVGKKLLTTGNGRCNLGHIMPDTSAYRGDERFIHDLLEELGPTGVFSFFKSIGVLLKTDSEGRIYPYSNSANTVLDALRREIERLGIRIICDCKITAIDGRDGEFVLAGSESIKAKKVIVATGGIAAPSSGSDGSGFELLKSLGINHTELRPALTGIKCDGTARYKGIRVKASVTLRRNGKGVSFSEGELQFGDRGISGICVFDISRYARKGDEVVADLLPDYSVELAAELLRELDGGRGLSATELLSGVMNKRFAEAVSGSVKDGDYTAIAKAVKSLSFKVDGVQSFANAQVTAGGISPSEVGTDLQAVKVKGLYIVGELLDVDGICGGYNLHWAWSTGIRAAREAVAAIG